jgi:hypothetical protein
MSNKETYRGQADRKARRMTRAISNGYAEGQFLGLPIIGGLIGAIKAWLKTTIALFKEDMKS